MISRFGLAAFIAVAPIGAAAHPLIVLASVECEMVTEEAKFSNGNPVMLADVHILDYQNELLTTLRLAMMALRQGHSTRSTIPKVW